MEALPDPRAAATNRTSVAMVSPISPGVYLEAHVSIVRFREIPLRITTSRINRNTPESRKGENTFRNGQFTDPLPSPRNPDATTNISELSWRLEGGFTVRTRLKPDLSLA